MSNWVIGKQRGSTNTYQVTLRVQIEVNEDLKLDSEGKNFINPRGDLFTPDIAIRKENPDGEIENLNTYQELEKERIEIVGYLPCLIEKLD